MKKNLMAALAAATVLFAAPAWGQQDIDTPTIGGAVVDLDKVSTAPSVSAAAKAAAGIDRWATRAQIEEHVLAGASHHGTRRGDWQKSFSRRKAGSTRRVAAARKSKEATIMPTTPNINVTVNVPQQKAVGLPNDPDFGGTTPFDGNAAVKGGASVTYSRGENGDLYFNSQPDAGFGLTWLWILLGVLGAVALLALIARALGGGGGGGNHYHNYPPQPAPAVQGGQAAAPFVPQQPIAPAVNGGGHGGGAPQGPQPGWQAPTTPVTVNNTVNPAASPIQRDNRPPRKDGGKTEPPEKTNQ
jgi:hypothetical protein